MTVTLNEDLLIQDTEDSKVYDIPFGFTYNVYSKIFDKTVVCKRYTKDIEIVDGWIAINFIHKKKEELNSIRRPYHFVKDNVLYVLKNRKQQTIDGFALNHELFSLNDENNWDTCMILHPYNDSECIFSCSKKQWLEEGNATQQNQELQVYMKIEDYKRHQLNVIPDAGKEWLEEALVALNNWRLKNG